MNSIEGTAEMTKPHMCYYITAFLDLLGTSARYNRLGGIFNRSDEKEKQNIIHSVYYPLITFREIFNNFYLSFNDQQKTSKIQKTLREEQKIETPHVNVQNCSDSVILNLPLVTEHSRAPMISGLLPMISACSAACFICASKGILIRGGIELGEGIQISKNEMIGKALSDAVELEKKYHQPRIIIGPRLLKMLDEFSSLDTPETAPFQDLINKDVSEAIKKVICRVEKTDYALDYILVSEKGVLGEREEYPLPIDQIMLNLVRVIETALINPDYNKATHSKYVYLENYVKSKIGVKKYTKLKVT